MRKITSVTLLLLFLALIALQSVQAQEQNRQRPQREPNTLNEREKEAGFTLLFDGKALDKELWQGSVDGYKVADGTMVCDPGGSIFTKKEYKDFVFRFEFKLPPAGNNGVGIRGKVGTDSAYNGHEIQILDDSDERYKNLADYQFHGSVYRFVPAKRGSLRPVGEWNREEIIVYGNKIKVVCNGQTIVDTDMTDFIDGTKKPLDGRDHKFNETGSIGFLGHGDPVAFRSVRVKEITSEEEYERYKNAPERRGRPGNRE